MTAGSPSRVRPSAARDPADGQVEDQPSARSRSTPSSRRVRANSNSASSSHEPVRARRSESVVIATIAGNASPAAATSAIRRSCSDSVQLGGRAGVVVEGLGTEPPQPVPERMHRVVDQVGGEAAGQHLAGHGVHVAEHRRGPGGPGLDCAPHPGMTDERPPGGSHALGHRVAPVARIDRRLVADDDGVHHAREQVLLVGDVLVQSHRGDPEAGGEAAHAHRVEALGIGRRDGRRDRTLAGEGRGR